MGDLDADERQRRDQRDDGEAEEEGAGGDGRPLAQRHRVGGVAETGDEHQQVAEVEAKAGEDGKVASRRQQGDAGNGDDDAHGLQAGHRGAIDEIGPGEDHDRDRPLDDADVHGGGVDGGDVEEGVEAGEADHAHHCQPFPVGADDRPLRPERGAGMAIISVSVPTHRKVVSTMGETWPMARRLAMALPAQIKVVAPRMR